MEALREQGGTRIAAIAEPCPRPEPGGFLLLLDPRWTIAAASADIGDHFAIDAARLIGGALTDLWSGETVHTLRNQLALARSAAIAERMYRLPLGPRSAPFDIAIRRAGEAILVEGRPSPPPGHRDLGCAVRGMIAELDGAATLPALLELAARQLRALTGFTRIAIFGPAPSGAIGLLAQHSRAATAAFPAELDAAWSSDDPADRPLLAEVVADCASPPAAMVGRAGGAERPAGLARRSAELGLRAVVRLALRLGGGRHGWVLGFDPAPRLLEYEQRSAIELYAQMLGMRLECRDLASRLDAQRGAAGGKLE